MKRWDHRPFEVRNLFNPAFCGLVLFKALLGYEEENPDGMPYSLALLVLPLCLHKDSRLVLADNSRSYLLKTVENNPQLLVGFAARASDLMPFSLEAFHVWQVEENRGLGTTAFAVGGVIDRLLSTPMPVAASWSITAASAGFTPALIDTNRPLSRMRRA